ncbi:hypothetical protein pb186bvf_020464 [Paramecium bursaria]
MYNIIGYEKDTNFLYPLSVIGVNVALAETLTYPLDRLQNKQMHYREKGLAQRIYKLEGIRGFYKGLVTHLERQIIKYTSSYFAYQFIFSKLTFKMYSKPNLQAEWQKPNLRYHGYYEMIVNSLAASTISTLLTQTSSIIKLKIQCDPIGFKPKKGLLTNGLEIQQMHRDKFAILLRAGLQSRIILNFSLLFSELLLAQTIFTRYHYHYLNYIQDYKFYEQAENLKYLLPLFVSTFNTILFQPLFNVQKRYTMRLIANQTTLSLRDMIFIDLGKGLYSGLLTNLIRSNIRNTALFLAVWNSAS